jgi:hypothetical protein
MGNENVVSARLIKANGDVTNIEPKNGKEFTLEELQGYVGGLIQLVQTKDGKSMIINEEGKLEGLEKNNLATELYKYGEDDDIVGDAVLILDEKTFN